jgi:hypothetical protein
LVGATKGVLQSFIQVAGTSSTWRDIGRSSLDISRSSERVEIADNTNDSLSAQDKKKDESNNQQDAEKSDTTNNTTDDGSSVIIRSLALVIVTSTSNTLTIVARLCLRIAVLSIVYVILRADKDSTIVIRIRRQALESRSNESIRALSSSSIALGDSAIILSVIRARDGSGNTGSVEANISGAKV